MTSPFRPCPRCGRFRAVQGHANNPCMDCRHLRIAVLPEHELKGGHWINDQGISRYHLYDDGKTA